MFNFWDLNNSYEIFSEFVEILKKFDKELNQYNTDVYIYVDENNNGRLYEFVNVGGNSWLNDEHYVLYTDKQHYNSYIDWFSSEYEIAYALGMTVDDLIKDVLYHIGDPDLEPEDVTYNNVVEYVANNEEYEDKLYDAYCDYIDEVTSDYEDKAHEFVDKFNRDIEESAETYD